MNKLTREEVLHVARLARIRVSEEEIEKYSIELKELIDQNASYTLNIHLKIVAVNSNIIITIVILNSKWIVSFIYTKLSFQIHIAF